MVNLVNSTEHVHSKDYGCSVVHKLVFLPHLFINGEYSQNRSKSAFLARWADF